MGTLPAMWGVRPYRHARTFPYALAAVRAWGLKLLTAIK